MTKNIYDFNFIVTTNNEKKVNMKQYVGKVLLIVNVASKCGFSSQYEQLELLYKKYKNQGFIVLGFPCNQFAKQEPGTNAEIEKFCKLTYDVTFPIFAKIEVNGKNAAPLYEFLKKYQHGIFGSKKIKWNFTKFLISRTGEVIARSAPMTNPLQLEKKIIEALNLKE